MVQGSKFSKGKMRRGRGFSRAGGLVQTQIRKVSEGRGFAVSRLVTHWSEVVGEDVAKLCQPVKVQYGRAGLGASLTILARGAAAPMLQAQLPQLRERVNACYGYNAVAQIKITQTAPTGFGEGQSPFAARPSKPAPAAAPSPAALDAVRDVAKDVSDPDLRAALTGLAARVKSAGKS